MCMSNNYSTWAERESARYFNLCRSLQEMSEQDGKSQEELLRELEYYESNNGFSLPEILLDK